MQSSRGLRIGAAFTAAVAIVVGLLTLLGLLVGGVPGLIADFFLRITPVLVAVALLIGVLNLVFVHLSRIARRRRGWLYSIVLLLCFSVVVTLGVISRTQPNVSGVRQANVVLLDTVQVSLESAFAALLLFALVYGAARLLRDRITWSGLLFIAVLLFVLIAALPLPALQERLRAFNDWLYAVPVEAGARGILLGIALATVVAGIRVLTGQDRSYRE